MTTENTTPTLPTLTVILDSVGRTILGETTPSSEPSIVSLKNPVVLHVIPADNQGKMSVQLLPLFFREFLGDKTGDVVVKYPVSRVSTTDIDALDFRLQAQYAQMFNKNNAFVAPAGSAPAQNETPKVINLFDE
jgi:hypothetical protein